MHQNKPYKLGIFDIATVSEKEGRQGTVFQIFIEKIK